MSLSWIDVIALVAGIFALLARFPVLSASVAVGPVAIPFASWVAHEGWTTEASFYLFLIVFGWLFLIGTLARIDDRLRPIYRAAAAAVRLAASGAHRLVRDRRQGAQPVASTSPTLPDPSA